MDRLSDLPSYIIETILCRIPIQEAGRTSVLAKEWRYRWTKIPKLVFNEFTFDVSTADGAESSIVEQKHLKPNKRRKMGKQRSKLIYAVGQVLLMHDGPIDEFTLTLSRSYQSVEIHHILTHLSRKTSIKKLNMNFNIAGYRLPSSNFSFHQLTDLCLYNCSFDDQATFNLGSLTRLYLQNVSISTRSLQHLLSSCPLLKTVFLVLHDGYISRSNDGPTFMELLECLPMIETLSVSFELIKVFEDSADGMVSRVLPTPLFHLKYLFIYDIGFTRKEELILALLIKSSPNLEKLKICEEGCETFMESSRVGCYPGIMLEHLNELEIIDFVNHKTRLDFVKLILARSPVLKKVRISLHYDCRNKRLQILAILLGYLRASPDVLIILEDP